MPIPPRKGDWNEAVLPKAREVAAALRAAGVRVHLDDREPAPPGFKYADWEMRGVPLRLELGPKDIEKDQCVLVRRDTREKSSCRSPGSRAASRDARHASRRTCWSGRGSSSRTAPRGCQTYDEFKQVMAEKRGFILAGWCGDAGVRGEDQGGDEGHDPRDPARGRAAPRPRASCGKPSAARSTSPRRTRRREVSTARRTAPPPLERALPGRACASPRGGSPRSSGRLRKVSSSLRPNPSSRMPSTFSSFSSFERMSMLAEPTTDHRRPRPRLARASSSAGTRRSARPRPAAPRSSCGWRGGWAWRRCARRAAGCARPRPPAPGPRPPRACAVGHEVGAS